MADDDQGATPLEVISPNEALQRQRSGGYLADGSPAPQEALVDNTLGPAGGDVGGPPAGAAQPPTPKAKKTDDEFWSSFEKSDKTGKSDKSAKASKAPADPEAAYWDQYGQPDPGPPPPAPPPPKPPGFWRQAVSAYGDLQSSIGQAATNVLSGLGGVTNSTAGNLNMIAGLAVQSAEAYKDLFTGKVKSLDQAAPTDWQDAWFRNTVDPTEENAKNFALDASAPFSEKAAHAVGQTLGVISQAVLTGGEATEPSVMTAAGEVKSGLQLAGETAMHGVKSAQAPAVNQAIDVGKQAYAATGDSKLAVKLATTAYMSGVVTNFAPLAAPGNLAMRAASGGAIQATMGEATREVTNAELPDAMSDQQKRALPDDQLATQNTYERGVDSLRQEFSPEGIALDFIQGAAMGGVAGPRPEMPNGMPKPAVEKPQNIMEKAQIVAAAEAAQNGGDLLDQTVASTHVNAVLSAHHDAAAFEMHKEIEQTQAAQMEQDAQDALKFKQAEEAAKNAPSPDEAFTQHQQDIAAATDADYTKALNQKGDQEVARARELDVAAEKGGAKEPGPTLGDTLSPEEINSFKTLAERRQAEMKGELPPPTDEEKFTPYVEPKSEVKTEEPKAEEPKAAEPAVDEDINEGDSWQTPTGATVDVLKDHGDGTFTIRTTPKDSSLKPVRRRVAEETLQMMKPYDEPAPDEPQTLAQRREMEQTGSASPAASEESRGPSTPTVEPEAAGTVSTAELDAAAHEAATSPKNDEPIPTAAQQYAGNYKMGHTEVQGMPITIEHPEGATRPNGVEQPAHYGYFKGTTDADGMHTDVLVGKHPDNETAFVVDHLAEDGSWEQHKVLLGFNNRIEAMRAYTKAYPNNPRGPVSEVKTSDLKDWLKNGDTTKPYDQRAVNRLGDTRDPQFADKGPKFSPDDVKHTMTTGPEGRVHVAESPGGKTEAVERYGNLHVTSSATDRGLRGAGEGTARVEKLAQVAHERQGKLMSDNRVSEPEQRVYESLKNRGYDVKENPNTVDPGTGEKISKSELKPVYEVGPKNEADARDTSPKGWGGVEAGETAPKVTQEQAEATMKPLLDKVGPDRMQVHADHTTLPDKILESAAARNIDPENIRGVYSPDTDTVHVVAGAHTSAEQALRTGVHEIVGHQGIRKLLGDDFSSTMLDVYKNLRDGPLPEGFRKMLKDGVAASTPKEWVRDYMDQHGLDPRSPRHQALAAGEYVAHLAEHDVGDRAQEHPSILRRAIDAVRSGLRKLGLVRDWTDNDIRALLRESANNLESEHAVAAKQYRGDGPDFALKEDEPNGLDPTNPLNTAAKFGKSMEEQANYNPGFLKSRVDWLHDKLTDTIDARMAFIGLRNIPDFMDGKLMPSLRQFIRVHDQMDGRRGELMQRAADVAKDWSRYVSKDKERGGALGELMHASTLGGVDPSKKFAERYTDSAKAKDATKAAHEAMRKDLHKMLSDVYNKTLDDKGRELFNTVRDHYSQSRKDVFDALNKRIQESGADNNTKKAIMAELRQKFEDGRVQGPYFPLARFGDHWASAKDSDGNTVSFSRFESASQKKAWINEMKEKGFATDGGQKMDDKSMMERIDPQFVQKITSMAKEVSPDLADEIWQTYLKAMPEMSMRKHFIHRVGRLGFTMDALRAFANNSFHGAHQLARLEYGNRLDDTLDSIKSEARSVEQADPTSKNAQWAPALAREMARRYEWIKNPRSSGLASALTKFGFAWYLGAAPATAFRIFSQNPMLAAPMLAKYHGPIGATRELAKASAQWAMSKGSLGDTLRGDERKAFDQANQVGVFSNTNTQMLASGGSGDPMYTGAAYHVSQAAGFLFNAMEHHNRMTTYLAAYRLGKLQGMSHDDAVNHAADLTWDSHFDYTNANRPRVLQNDAAKVALLFKQYSWGVTYRLAREFRDTINSQLPAEQRRGAAMAFGGLIGRQMMFSGVVGLPLYWVAESVVNAIMGDKDRPYDMTAAVHKQLTDHLGQTASDAVMTGPVGAVSGASLSGGASYNDLWYRPPSRDETAPEQVSDAIGQLGGAIPAIATNAATGAQMMHDGNIERGLEHFVPPEAASIMKAIRYSKEGVTNLQGEPVLSRDELDNKDLFLQALGFTPQKVADAYARNAALKNISKEIMDRREQLLNHVTVAAGMDDSSEIDKAMTEVSDFNEKNPGVAIPGKAIVSSMRNRFKNAAESVNGVKLPNGLSDLYGQYGASDGSP